MNKDYYSVLGVPKDASQDDIKKAYRQLAMKFHPDRVPESEKIQAEEKFKEINEAYDTLGSADKREQFDMYGSNPQPSNFGRQTWTHGGDNADIFREMFGDMFGQHAFRQANRTVIYPINISLQDAYVGKYIKVDSKTTVQIPKGVRPGTKFYSDNKLYQVNILQHPKFKRSGDDLLVEVEIDAFEAMLGLSVILEHLDGIKLQFSIPPGIQNGQIIKLSAKGMQNPEIDRKGDLLVRSTISIPKTLTEEQKEILKKMSKRDSINI